MSEELGPTPQPPPSPFGPPASETSNFEWMPPLPRPKFQHNYRRHTIFFLLTLFTTTTTNLLPAVIVTLVGGQAPTPLFTWRNLLDGLSYSIPILTILSAHEFGHYIACRVHNVDATLPYFIPAPILMTGTLGAVIRIREAFPSKRALFDVGVAGPLAGFVVLVPIIYWGVTLSEVSAVPSGGFTILFGEPLLWKALEWLHFGPIPEGMDVMMHPVAFAAWFGMFATALNLLPFGQLDGGHIMYASLGRRAAALSVATLIAVTLLSLRSTSWIVTAGLMAVMAVIFGFRHPHIIDEHEPLDSRRRLVAIVALIVFVICFTPLPIQIMGE